MRITPAGAGKTERPWILLLPTTDHPRRCGENMIPSCQLCVNTGSPPQVRGKQDLVLTQRRIGRITPAGAGKTSCISSKTTSIWDHPRRCGENYWENWEHFLHSGSPPQVRGKLSHIGFCVGKTRITPAGAGKTFAHFVYFLLCQDHPRRCGENFIVLLAEQAEMGSPPQVRGKLIVIAIARNAGRITPAGAGKTE